MYERSAAFYFNLILESEHLKKLFRGGSISAFELIVASDGKLQDLILEGEGRLIEIKKLFEFGIRKLEAQGAGLIELISATDGDTTDGTLDYRIYKSNEWDDLLLFTNFRVKFIHRTASDFLTDTEQGRAILGLDATSRQDKVVALIRAAITECNMWRREYSFRDELQNFIIFSSTILTTTISKIEKQKLLNQLEREWYKILREPADSRTWNKPLPDFLGLSASINSSAYVISRLEEIQSTHSKEISQDYKNYLLQQATGSFPVMFWKAHQWHSQLHLIRFLLSQGAKSDHATYRFDSLKNWILYSGIYVTTPISNIIQEAFRDITFFSDGGVLRHSNHVASDLCRPIRLAMQSSGGREPQVIIPITFADNKVLFLEYNAIWANRIHSIILETNIVFHVLLLLDVLMIKNKGIEQSLEFIALEATVKEEFIRNRQISATAKLVSFNDHYKFDEAYDDVLIAPISMDSDGLRLKIRQMLQSKSDNTKFQRFRKEMFGMMHEAAGNKVRAKSKSRFHEALKGHRFYGWPPPEEHRKVWPPPMWL